MMERTSGPVVIALLAVPFALAVLASAARADDAAAIFAKQCASCHGADGSGNGPAAKLLKPKPADLRDAAWAKGVQDEELVKAIKGGGGAVGKGKTMPAFPKLSDDDVNALVKVVRGFSAGK